MIKYIPCLKLKQNEIQGVSALDPGIRNQIAPLYDVPRTQESMSESDVAKRVQLALKELSKSKAVVGDYKFILDNFDLDDNIDLSGVPQYRAILASFTEHLVVPTIAFDRHPDHNDAALDYVTKSKSDIAIRLQEQDIVSYRLAKFELDAIWPGIQASNPSNIILVIDQRVITDTADAVRKIGVFLSAFENDFRVDVTAVTGSVIPSSIADLIGTNNRKHILRKEFRMWRALQSQPAFEKILYGDYGVISPEYSDVDLPPELLSDVAAPKVFYTYQERFYVVRGRRFKTHGYDQYFDIADLIVKEPFYRKNGYSFGDSYIHERSNLSSKKPDKGGSPSSWIKSLTAAHITFVVNTI